MIWPCCASSTSPTSTATRPRTASGLSSGHTSSALIALRSPSDLAARSTRRCGDLVRSRSAALVSPLRLPLHALPARRAGPLLLNLHAPARPRRRGADCRPRRRPRDEGARGFCRKLPLGVPFVLWFAGASAGPVVLPDARCGGGCPFRAADHAPRLALLAAVRRPDHIVRSIGRRGRLYALALHFSQRSRSRPGFRSPGRHCSRRRRQDARRTARSSTPSRRPCGFLVSACGSRRVDRPDLADRAT